MGRGILAWFALRASDRCRLSALGSRGAARVSRRHSGASGVSARRLVCAEGERQALPVGPRQQEGGEGLSPSLARERSPLTACLR